VTDPIAANRDRWNALVPIHVGSAFYDVDGWKAGERSLDRYVVAGLGDVTGKRVLHLQCHFGLDTLTLARMGARPTGVDFSGVAVAQASALAAELGLNARFVESNVIGLDLSEQFDVVFTSWGALIWLPDINEWAQTVVRHLAPGGRLVVVEQHSTFWCWDDSGASPPYTPVYRYDTGEKPLHFAEPGTYADLDADIVMDEFIWNHPPAEIVTAVATAGLRVERMDEHAALPWKALPWMEELDGEPGWFRLPGDPLPLSFTLVARADS
jgi:SAM-dependent methyltransferase